MSTSAGLSSVGGPVSSGSVGGGVGGDVAAPTWADVPSEIPATATVVDDSPDATTSGASP